MLADLCVKVAKPAKLGEVVVGGAGDQNHPPRVPRLVAPDSTTRPHCDTPIRDPALELSGAEQTGLSSLVILQNILNFQVVTRYSKCIKTFANYFPLFLVLPV